MEQNLGWESAETLFLLKNDRMRYDGAKCKMNKINGKTACQRVVFQKHF